MSDVEDTETLLALLASLLDHPVHDQSMLLDALVRSEGDVERAARFLNASKSSSKTEECKTSNKIATPQSAKKRKRNTGLEGWLVQGEAKRANTDVSPNGKRTTSPIEGSLDKSHVAAPLEISHRVGESSKTCSSSAASSPTKVKPVSRSEFMSIFQQPEPASKSGPPKLPPLTLATPDMVANHTPCTMHLSVLPPELACRYVRLRST
jgi:hypothetical protein